MNTEVSDQIPQSYDSLLERYLKAQQELDTANQSLYATKLQYESLRCSQRDYEDEITSLQTEGIANQKKFESKIHQLEDDLVSQKNSFNDRIHSFEKQLIDKDEEIGDLKKELEVASKITHEQQLPDQDKLLEEIAWLKQEKECFEELTVELQDMQKKDEIEKLALLENVSQLKKEIEDFKETLKCKRDELAEANDLIQTLKDDVFCVKSELETLKATPLNDKSRGNSLFAEVDDRRVQLQNNMKLMKDQYREMKTERASLLKQITNLRKENAALIARWDNEIEERERDDQDLIASYQAQLKTLNELIVSYQKELQEKYDNVSTLNSVERFQFYDNMMKMKNREIEEMRMKFSERSINETSLRRALGEAQKEIRRLNQLTLQLQNQIGCLQTEIEEMKMKSPTEIMPETEQKLVLKSIVKNTVHSKENVDLAVEDGSVSAPLEVDSQKRHVQFQGDSVDSHVTVRRSVKKGVKIFSEKPTHISSNNSVLLPKND